MSCTFHIFSCVGPFHPGFRHVEDFSFLSCRLEADLLVFLDSVICKIPPAVFASLQVVPGLWSKQRPSGRSCGSRRKCLGSFFLNYRKLNVDFYLLLNCRRWRNWLFGIFDFYFDRIVGVGVAAIVLGWAPWYIGGWSGLYTGPAAVSVLLKGRFSARTSAPS